MKKIYAYFLVLFLMLFMSACSQAPRYSNYRAPAYQASQQNHPATRQTGRISQQHSQVAQVPRQSSSNYNPARQRMINIAGSTVGTPYRWGGDNPRKGFDCSGLMTYVHKNALGMRIPRTTAQQRDQSRTITYAQLQPGDMLFFKTGRKTNHVGVYIGNRKFIHAPSSGKRVTVASMDSSYWYKRFVKFGTFL